MQHNLPALPTYFSIGPNAVTMITLRRDGATLHTWLGPQLSTVDVHALLTDTFETKWEIVAHGQQGK